LFVLVSSAALTASASAQEQSAGAILQQAVANFEKGRLTESAAGFDKVAALVPDRAPELWQRGIALYYVGRYDDCRKQFESHRLVNPDDVENAAWHFLCVARAESPESARRSLLPVGPDPRVPMRQIYEMFRGSTPPEQVLATAGARAEAQFYAHLYIGLYYEALGTTARALQHLEMAARATPETGGYMQMVARVHVAQRQLAP
jgi:lipoprotein NlpI